MFLNNDLLFVLGAGSIIVGGLIITYSFYNDIFPTVNQSESLVNTVSNLNSNVQLVNLPNHSYVDSIVQTDNIKVEATVQTVNTYINTGMQTSSRMWLESIKNWINEILADPVNPQASGQYVDVGVQTNVTTALQNNQSMWTTVKQWFLEVCSIRSSDISSMGYNKVNKWRNNLDDIQSVDLHDSESPLTVIRFGTESPLQQLVGPNDSASNISEVISNVEVSNRVYDITDPEVLKDLLDDSTVYSYYDHTDHINYVISDVLLSVDPSIVNLIF
jgi:hypothetical protein